MAQDTKGTRVQPCLQKHINILGTSVEWARLAFETYC